MKKAFTLIELLVVVVVIVTLMAITFRIANVGTDSTARNLTMGRMQRLENCLSGYFAAFGGYPPVEIHGSRDYRYDVGAYGGVQCVSSGNGGSGGSGSEESRAEGAIDGSTAWANRIDAACRAQPIGMEFPYKDQSMYEYAEEVSKYLFEEHKVPLFHAMVLDKNTSIMGSKEDLVSWPDVQAFKFGLMSYLLPRYLIMLGGTDGFFDEMQSWRTRNKLPCRFENGEPYSNWRSFINDEINANTWKAALLPSQSVAARWMPNLEGTLRCDHALTVYGVNVVCSDLHVANISIYNHSPKVYSVTPNRKYEAKDGESTPSSGSQLYALDSVTCVDGWGKEFYYYSSAPFQSYRLWSAGPNGRTFPPWVTPEQLGKMSTTEKRLIEQWTVDDISFMSH